MLLDLIPPAWRGFAKAVVAAFIPVLAAAITGLVTGAWDVVGLAGLLIAAVSSIAVYVTAAIPALKAVVAALVVIAGIAITGVLTGEWDRVGLAGGITALVSALLVYRTPNERAP